MYSREIPEENRAEIKSIMQKMSILPEYEDLKRLFYFYYRYIKVFKRYENPEQQMLKDLNCPACKGKVIMYFRNIIHQW